MKLMLGLLLWSAPAFGNNPPFQPGEKLFYSVSWFVIPAGDAGLEVGKVGMKNGIPCYHFSAWAKSTLLFFFKVNDVVESYATTETLKSAQFEKHIREGNYAKDQIIPFDLDNSTAKYKDGSFPVGAGCRDALAAFYYFRMMPLPEPGGAVTICSHTDKKNYPLMIKVLKREKLKVAAGEFNTVLIKVMPQPGFEGLFRTKGDFWIWLTDDHWRVPVQMKVSVPIIGSVKTELVKMELAR